MNKLDKFHQFLSERYGLFKTEFKIFDYFLSALNDIEITRANKLLMVIHYIFILGAMFRTKVRYKDTLVPVNDICFLFSPSGTGKDYTRNIMENLFKPLFDDIRDKLEVEYNLGDVSKEKLFPETNIGFSTPEGLHLALNNLFYHYFTGCINIYSSEFISELKSNPNASQFLRDITEIAMNGSKPLKQIKDNTRQLKPINNVNMVTLFVSDITELLVNADLSLKLKSEFSKGLSRRCFVSFNKNIISNNINDFDLDSFIATTENSDMLAKGYSEIKANITDRIAKIVETNGKNDMNNFVFTVDNECAKLLTYYNKYCNLLAAEILKNASIGSIGFNLYPLHLKDNYFRALRLAAAISVLKCEKKISIDTLVEAINVTDLLSNEMKELEKEISRTPNEIFVYLCNISDIKEHLSSDLVKAGFIKSNWNVSDLARLSIEANQIDSKGLYTYTDESIIYEPFEQDTKIAISYKSLPPFTTKEDWNQLCGSGYIAKTYENFEELAELLNTDCSFSPFIYKDGKRDKEHCINRTSVLVFDIDKSTLDIDEVHQLICKQNINHHIAMTSDPNNVFKFRVILELDKEYPIQERLYRKIMLLVKKKILLDLFECDSLPMSQMFYGYSNRSVSSLVFGESLCLKNFIVEAMNETKTKALTKQQISNALNNSFYETFSWAFEQPSGKRNITLIRLINAMKNDYLATHEQILEGVHKANNTFDNPLSDEELEKTIFPHLNKLFNV